MPLDPLPQGERPRLDCTVSALWEMPWEVLDAIAAPLWITDEHHRWIFLNAACSPLVGHDHLALVGQREMDVLPLGVSQEVMAAKQRAIASGEAQSFAIEMTDAAGEYRRLTATAWQFFAPDGDLRLLISLQDVTPLHRVEQTLQRQAERERLLGAIAQHLLQSLNFEDLLQTTVNEVRRFLRVDRVLFYGFDPDYTGVVAESAQGLEGDAAMAPTALQTDLRFIPADLMRYRQGEMDVIDDVATAHLPPAYRAKFDQAQIKACVIMPIVQGEAIYGLVCALDCSGPRPWSTWE
ncbi:MAG: GAF domain-containing protein, partial [Nodosilinea sp.]